jgi:hypothetical protein
MIGMPSRSIAEAAMKRFKHLPRPWGAALVFVLGGCAGTGTIEPEPLTSGDRVRVTASVVPGEVKGQVRELTQDELLLSVGSGDELVIPVETLQSLAIQRGTRRRVKEGALIGLGTGGVAFLAILASEGGCSGDSMCESAIGLVAGVFVAGGALLGTLVGLLIETDVWEDQPLPFAVEAAPDGLRVEFRLPVGGMD